MISRSPESSCTATPTIAAPTVAPAENAPSGAAELDEPDSNDITSHKELQTTENAAADEMQDQGKQCETSRSGTNKNLDTNADDDLRFAVAPGGNFQFDPETGELFLQPQVMLSRRSSTVEEVGADHGDSLGGHYTGDRTGSAAPELDEKAAIEVDDEEVIEPQAAQVVENVCAGRSDDGQEVVAGPVQSENPKDAGGRTTATDTRERGRVLVPVSSEEELHTDHLNDDSNKEMLDVASFCNPDVLVVTSASTAQATAEPERLLAADDIGDKYLKTDGAKNEEKEHSPDHDRQEEQSDLLAHIAASPPLLSLDSSSRLITPLQETMSPLVYNKVATLLGGIFDKVAASTIEEGDEDGGEDNHSTVDRAGKGSDAEVDRDPRIIQAGEQDTTATSGEDIVAGEMNEKIGKTTSPGLRREVVVASPPVIDETTGVANCRKDDHAGAKTTMTPGAQELPALSLSSSASDDGLHQQVETTTCSSSSRSTKEAGLAGAFSSSSLLRKTSPTAGIIAKKPSSVDSEKQGQSIKDSVASSTGTVAACTDGDDEAATGKRVELHPVDAVSTSTNGGSKPTTDEEQQTTTSTATASPWISSLYGSTAHILSIGTAKIIQNVTNFIADDDDLEDYFVGGEYLCITKVSYSCKCITNALSMRNIICHADFP